MHKNVERDMKAAKDALEHAAKNTPNREDELNFDLASAVAFALLSVDGAIGHLGTVWPSRRRTRATVYNGRRFGRDAEWVNNWNGEVKKGNVESAGPAMPSAI